MADDPNNAVRRNPNFREGGNDPHCPHCKGTGFVCEEHPTKPWEHGIGHGQCGGAGANCPLCNPYGTLADPDPGLPPRRSR